MPAVLPKDSSSALRPPPDGLQIAVLVRPRLLAAPPAGTPGQFSQLSGPPLGAMIKEERKAQEAKAVSGNLAIFGSR